MAPTVHYSVTRQHILSAALKHFARSGYAAASVQQIVDDARVSKPALYYHFPDKAGLFQALVNEAHDRELEVLRLGAGRSKNIRGQLVEILAMLFHYFQRNRDLVRIALATMFGAPGELPKGLRYLDRCERNFEFIHSLMKQAQQKGELDRQFESRELAFGFYGQTNLYLMAHLLMPGCRLNRKTAQRIVRLFLAGATAKRRAG
jgi:AcrR family transcriptional regulator